MTGLQVLRIYIIFFNITAIFHNRKHLPGAEALGRGFHLPAVSPTTDQSGPISPRALPRVLRRRHQGGPGLPGALWISSARLPWQAQAGRTCTQPCSRLRPVGRALYGVRQDSSRMGQPQRKAPAAPLLGVSLPLFSTAQRGQRAQEGSWLLFSSPWGEGPSSSSRAVHTWGLLGGLHPRVGSGEPARL